LEEDRKLLTSAKRHTFTREKKIKEVGNVI